MKINRQQLRQIISEELQKLGRVTTEATGGDGEFERVDETNWQHLEVGNTYSVKAGRDRTISGFVGWVDKGTSHHTDSEDPTEVNLRFVDVADGFEWEAYFFDGKYVVGSSADSLFVKEAH